jgi:hypothetical protein
MSESLPVATSKRPATLMDELISRYQMARAVRAERRIEKFIARTGLPIDQIGTVCFEHGEIYPQWIGAIDLLPIAARG